MIKSYWANLIQVLKYSGTQRLNLESNSFSALIKYLFTNYLTFKHEELDKNQIVYSYLKILEILLWNSLLKNIIFIYLMPQNKQYFSILKKGGIYNSNTLLLKFSFLGLVTVIKSAKRYFSFREYVRALTFL